jgi:predicted TIM-barrel fold metal-dependent hydrolase
MSTLLERGRLGLSLEDLDVVDIHGHLGRSPFAVPDVSAASLVAAMDRVGVATAVVSHLHCVCGGPSTANDEVLEAIEAFPGRIEGYVRLWPSSADEVRRETERFLDRGFVGVKLHNSSGFAYTDPALEPALAIADERRIPVLLHTYGNKDELEQARTLAGRYPHARFLLAHAGVNNSEDRYGELARGLENVYLDLCTSGTPRGSVVRLVEAAGVAKVMWGSDATFLNLGHQIGKVLGADLDEEVKRRLLSTNARAFLSGGAAY